MDDIYFTAHDITTLIRLVQQANDEVSQYDDLLEKLYSIIEMEEEQ